MFLHKNYSLMKIVITGVILPLFFFTCSTYPDYSIEVNGEEIASLRGDRSENSLNFVTDFENPIITGIVRLKELSIKRTTSGHITAAFSRSEIRASGRYFFSSDDNDEFLSITEPSFGIRGPFNMYKYSTPPIALPEGGTSVQLSLEVDGDLKLFANIQLSNDVIILPVNVHIFKNSRSTLDPRLSERHVTSWFDPPNIRTKASSYRDVVTGEIKTILKTIDVDRYRPLYVAPDSVWVQAKIQFKLISYEVIEDDQLEMQIISNNSRSLKIYNRHQVNRDVIGIHIYVGRNTEQIGNGLAAIAGQTFAPGCTNNTFRTHAIVLAWDQARG